MGSGMMISTMLVELKGKVCFLFSPVTYICAAQIGIIDELKRKWYTQLAECPAGPVSLRCPLCITFQATYTSTCTTPCPCCSKWLCLYNAVLMSIKRSFAQCECIAPFHRLVRLFRRANLHHLMATGYDTQTLRCPGLPALMFVCRFGQVEINDTLCTGRVAWRADARELHGFVLFHANLHCPGRRLDHGRAAAHLLWCVQALHQELGYNKGSTDLFAGLGAAWIMGEQLLICCGVHRSCTMFSIIIIVLGTHTLHLHLPHSLPTPHRQGVFACLASQQQTTHGRSRT